MYIYHKPFTSAVALCIAVINRPIYSLINNILNVSKTFLNLQYFTSQLLTLQTQYCIH